MIDEIQALLDRYVAWLRDRTSLRQVDDWVEITTPFLDRHNDCIQIYARRENGGYLLTDDGYILDDLALSGCKIESTKRQALLRMTLNGFGVQLKGSALEVRASMEGFAQRKHNLVQAMLAVNDMFCLATPVVASLFYEDVSAWLDLHDIRHIRNVSFPGRMGSSTVNRGHEHHCATSALVALEGRPLRLGGVQGGIGVWKQSRSSTVQR